MDEPSQGQGWAALLSAIKDLRISAHVSLSVAALCLILLALSPAASQWPALAFLLAWQGYLLVGAIGGATVFLVGWAIDADKRRRARAATRLEEATRRGAEDAAQQREQARRLAIFENMTLAERSKCLLLIASTTRASHMLDADPTVAHLVHLGVFERIGKSLPAPRGADTQSVYAVAEWAWLYLRSHPEIVGLGKEGVPPLKMPAQPS